jgi:hypothetical protein
MPTIYNGARFTTGNLISNPGRLQGFLISHAQASIQTVTFYDATTAYGTILAIIHLAPEGTPHYLMLPRDKALEFDTGLSATYTNCEVLVWAVEHD